MIQVTCSHGLHHCLPQKFLISLAYSLLYTLIPLVFFVSDLTFGMPDFSWISWTHSPLPHVELHKLDFVRLQNHSIVWCQSLHLWLACSISIFFFLQKFRIGLNRIGLRLQVYMTWWLLVSWVLPSQHSWVPFQWCEACQQNCFCADFHAEWPNLIFKRRSSQPVFEKSVFISLESFSPSPNAREEEAVTEINTTWCKASNPFSQSIFFTTHTMAWGIDYWLAWERQHRAVDFYNHSCSGIFVSSIPGMFYTAVTDECNCYKPHSDSSNPTLQHINQDDLERWFSL
jgi:hypothetical protein